MAIRYRCADGAAAAARLRQLRSCLPARSSPSSDRLERFRQSEPRERLGGEEDREARDLVSAQRQHAEGVWHEPVFPPRVVAEGELAVRPGGNDPLAPARAERPGPQEVGDRVATGEPGGMW